MFDLTEVQRMSHSSQLQQVKICPPLSPLRISSCAQALTVQLFQATPKYIHVWDLVVDFLFRAYS